MVFKSRNNPPTSLDIIWTKKIINFKIIILQNYKIFKCIRKIKLKLKEKHIRYNNPIDYQQKDQPHSHNQTWDSHYHYCLNKTTIRKGNKN